MSACIALNEQKNGIEVRFDTKPLPEIIESLKKFGFRWSGKQKMWFAKQTQERMSFVNSLNDDVNFALYLNNKQEKNSIYDLWEMTRVDTIENNFSLYGITDVKRIAAILRKHIKPRFPMCKFSITSDYNSIDIELLSSPFESDSDELNAIVHYVYKYADSYNYDNSDIMSDYFDVNFYGVHERYIVTSRYKKIDTYESLNEIVLLFKNKQENFKKEETVREKREAQERIAQIEIERRIVEQREIEIKADAKYIEENSVVTECETPYYYIDLYSPHLNKLCNMSEAKKQIEQGSFKYETCEITREVNMSADVYNKFQNILLHSFSFLSGKGGTGTLDNRINLDIDYQKMSSEENKTVEFYSVDCVAIYCNGELKLVCNPEGFDYARYILIPTKNCKKTFEYKIEQVVSKEEMKHNYEIFEKLYDKSTELIFDNGLIKTWNNENFSQWRKLMVEYIISSNIELNINIIRSIPQDAFEFKLAMYRLLEESEDIYSQFRNYDFKDGQRITIFKMDELLGGVRYYKFTFKHYEQTNLGGKNGIKLFGKLANKRNEYSLILNDRILIVEDWIDIPSELFWEEFYSSTGLLCKKSRYSSFDDKQIDAVLSYLKQIKVKPIVNTYKPQF